MPIPDGLYSAKVADVVKRYSCLTVSKTIQSLCDPQDFLLDFRALFFFKSFFKCFRDIYIVWVFIRFFSNYFTTIPDKKYSSLLRISPYF